MIADNRNIKPEKLIGLFKKLVRLIIQILLLLILFLFIVLFIFRWVPIPSSAFMALSNKAVSYQWASWDEISPQLAIAVIASEDQRFPQHWGIDTIELKRALAEKRKQKGKQRPRGASTITQQVAKNLFLWNGRSYTRKAIEAGLAVALELAWPKKRILEVYLNVAQFGDGIFGARSASNAFFNKPAKQLSREESALLASVLPRPAVSNINDPSPVMLRKQQWILKQMKQLGGLNYLKRL